MWESPILINCIRMHVPGSRSFAGNFSLCMHLIQALEKLNRLNIYVHADPYTEPYVSAAVPANRMIVEKRPVDTILQMELAIARTIKEVKPIIYHKPTGQLPLIPVQCRTVWGVADLGYRHLPMGVAKKFYKQISYSRSAKRATHITAISNVVREEIITALHVEREKVTTIYCGTSELALPSTPIPNCPSLFMLAFGHQRHKNVETCIDVVAELKHSGVNIPLLVAGKVSQQADLEARALKASVADMIKFCGRVSDGELRFLYERAFCLLFLSRHEGFGLPVLEAMAIGCPVIASNAFALPEVVGKSAPVFDCDDAKGVAFEVRALLGDEALRKQRIAEGHKNTKIFSWERAAEETVAVYEKALSR